MISRFLSSSECHGRAALEGQKPHQVGGRPLSVSQWRSDRNSPADTISIIITRHCKPRLSDRCCPAPMRRVIMTRHVIESSWPVPVCGVGGISQPSCITARRAKPGVWQCRNSWNPKNDKNSIKSLQIHRDPFERSHRTACPQLGISIGILRSDTVGILQCNPIQ